MSAHVGSTQTIAELWVIRYRDPGSLPTTRELLVTGSEDLGRRIWKRGDH